MPPYIFYYVVSKSLGTFFSGRKYLVKTYKQKFKNLVGMIFIK